MIEELAKLVPVLGSATTSLAMRVGESNPSRVAIALCYE